MKKNLLEETLELARATKVPASSLCKSAGVSQRWFYKFVSGETRDPGIRRVQKLHDALANHPGCVRSPTQTDQEAAA